MTPIGVFVLCWAVFIFFEFSKKSQLVLSFRKNDLFSVPLTLAITLIIALNTYNADYQNYLRLYDSYPSDSAAPSVFGLLCSVGKLCNFDYQTFRCILICFSTFSVFHFIRKYSDNTAYILVLYCLSGFIMDSIQFRQFTAMGVYLIFVPFLLQDDYKHGKIIYALGTLVAAGIHPLFVFGFLFLVIKVKKELRIKVAVATVGCILLAFFILEKTGLLLPAVALILPSEKVELYFINDIYHSDASLVLRFIISQQIFLILILYLARILGVLENNNKALFWTVVGMNLLFLSICPILFYTLQFRRMFRILMVPSYIAVCKLGKKTTQNNRFILYIILLIFAFVSFRTNITNNPDIVSDLFSNNYLLG